ncbi:protein translocase SEC61 complex subunit gamma [Candidatus Aenigmatarchaeota archaeon]
MGRLKNMLFNIRRVLLIANKPDIQEFKTTTKITGMGIIIIGVIGFIIFIAAQLIGVL